MSSLYYIGTLKNNIINKPLDMSGVRATCLMKTLEYCGIDIYYDFNYFSSDEGKYNMLFYKILEEDIEIMKIDKFTDEDYYKDEIDYNEFPVLCDNISVKNGYIYYLINKNITIPQYEKFNFINLTINVLDEILKDYSGWKSNRSEWFYEELKLSYETIAEWINNNEFIYWWKYL